MATHDIASLAAMGIDPSTAEEVDALAAAGVGEGDFADDHGTPADLLELHEVLEWQRAVEGEGQ